MNGVALHTLEFFGYDVSGQFAGSLQGLKIRGSAKYCGGHNVSHPTQRDFYIGQPLKVV